MLKSAQADCVPTRFIEFSPELAERFIARRHRHCCPPSISNRRLIQVEIGSSRFRARRNSIHRVSTWTRRAIHRPAILPGDIARRNLTTFSYTPPARAQAFRATPRHQVVSTLWRCLHQSPHARHPCPFLKLASTPYRTAGRTPTRVP
jgi:hypothetical protein